MSSTSTTETVDSMSSSSTSIIWRVQVAVITVVRQVIPQLQPHQVLSSMSAQIFLTANRKPYAHTARSFE